MNHDMDGSSDVQLRRALLSFVEQDSLDGAEDSSMVHTEERQASAVIKVD